MSFAVLCPGQGAQHPAMLDLVRASPAANRVFDEAREALGTDVRDWLMQGDAIFDNRIAQPLICIAQLATWRALRDALPAPAAFCGYSVGEVACYGLADALDATTLAKLANERALAMDDAARRMPGSLVGVRGLSRSATGDVARSVGGSIAIAVADDSFVVGVPAAAVTQLEAAARQAGAHTTPLRVGLASHTTMMAPAERRFRAALEQSALGPPRRPVVAGVDASLVRSRERAIDALSTQLTRTIEWSQCVDALFERGCRVFLELGPGRALARNVSERRDDVEARSIDEFRDLDAVAAWVKKKSDALA